MNREPGVDCGIVIDCQKALEYNLAVYNDENLTDSQKSKMYITKYDFPEGDPIFDWSKVLNLGFDPSDPNKFVFSTNFKRYTAMCFAIHNDFKPSTYGRGQSDKAQIKKQINFVRYKPPTQFITNVERDYKPLQAMTVDLEFGWARIFPFYCVGTITPTKPVSKDVAETIISKAKEALALYFSPANRQFGVKPTLMEVIDVIEKSDSRIRHFDPGSAKTEGIVWADCDIDYFNLISFAKYDDSKASAMNIRINPTYITNS